MNVLGRGVLFSCRYLSRNAQLMKGHSKWDNIKNIKLSNDAKKSQLLARLFQRLRTVVRHGGIDPKFNKELAEIQMAYRSANMSEEIFQRALKRASEQQQKMICFNFHGPSGSVFIVESESKSRRKLQEFINKCFTQVGGSFQLTTSDLSKAFEDKGVVVISARKNDQSISVDEVEELCIELDCEDVSKIDEDDEECYELVCAKNKYTTVRDMITERGYCVKSADVQIRGSNPVELSEDDLGKVRDLYQFLQENESITRVYDNIKPSSVTEKPLASVS